MREIEELANALNSTLIAYHTVSVNYNVLQGNEVCIVSRAADRNAKCRVKS